MKYFTNFKNKHGDEFSVSSMENYEISENDLIYFSQVLRDEPVRKYITDEAMSTWGHVKVESLASDILANSALRWQEEKELRFLLRNHDSNPIGMIGVTLKQDRKSGELWYYKISSVRSCMFEALHIVLPFIKNERVEKLIASFELDNNKSIDALQKLGFTNSLKLGEMNMEF